MNLNDINLSQLQADPSETVAPIYSIGDLAQEFGVTTRTIRFYEDKGLLNPRRDGLKRIYDQRDRVRLRLVLRGKRLGFSLDEIAGIIDMYDTEPGELGQLEYMLRRLAEQRQTLLQQKQDLEQTLSELDQIEAQCLKQLASMDERKHQ
ncbi:MAG: MerR family DNA-binding transcriptional regulator [Arenicellales bacterium]|nr:MerR family DNA-binding transcriptional regulator [Arenicellales bacterium]